MNIVIDDCLTKSGRPSYKQSELDSLWNILNTSYRTSPKRFGYVPIGLVEVAFEAPLNEFRDKCERNRFHVPWLSYCMISRSIPNCLDFISGKRILSHGLNCAAECKSPTNSAVSIYMMSHGNHEVTGVVLPGVNYVPSRENVSQWINNGWVEESEYHQWMEMIERINSSRDFSPV